MPAVLPGGASVSCCCPLISNSCLVPNRTASASQPHPTTDPEQSVEVLILAAFFVGSALSYGGTGAKGLKDNDLSRCCSPAAGTLQAGGICRNGGLRCFPDLGVAIEQHLRAVHVVDALRRPQVIVVEPVHVMRGIEDDERIVELLRGIERLVDLHRRAELAHQLDHARTVALDGPGLV